jgi:uncharacterized protein
VKTLFALTVTAFAFAAFAPAASAASFNCYGRLNITEAAICANPQLSSLDSKMAKAYRISFRAYGNYVKSSQVAWLRSRNACGGNVGCLRTSYANRIGSLQILDGDGAP